MRSTGRWNPLKSKLAKGPFIHVVESIEGEVVNDCEGWAKSGLDAIFRMERQVTGLLS